MNSQLIMPFPTRKRQRLSDYHYDYSAAYFITICVQQKMCLFGEIFNGKMVLNSPGESIVAAWHTLTIHYPTLQLDTFLLMPNHLHGLMIIEDNTVPPVERVSLSRIIQDFKSRSTNLYIQGVKTQGWKPFLGKLWQRGYYEHIIRNELDLNRVREYILNNPLQWELDEENPILQ